MGWWLGLLAGCSGGNLKGSSPPILPEPLVCPGPNPDHAAGWGSSANESLAIANPRVKHAAMDQLGLPAGIGFSTGFGDEEPGVVGRIPWSATIGVGPLDRGFEVFPVAEEQVSLADPPTDLRPQALSTVTAGAQGEVSFPGPQPDEGLVQQLLILEGDGSCAPFVSARLATGTPVVLTDIDGTLTISDDELFLQINDGTYDPVAYDGGAAMLQLWVEKGVQPIYMTARPHELRSETRTWLQQHGYPVGPVITSSQLIFGEATADYKRAWVERIVTPLGWSVVAAYGNADTDITAYLDGGIPADRVYIIGENAGAQGTVGVQDDWLAHTDAVVRPY